MSTSDDHAPGSADLSETVDDRPEIPEGAEPSLGGRAISEVDLSSDIESLFRESELFGDLTSDEVREIVRATDQVAYAAGETIFSQGDSPDAFYFIENGEVEVRATTDLGEDVVLAILGTGTVVGEMALLGGGPRTATVEALSECSVFRLSRAAFDRLRDERSHAAYKLILNLARTVGHRRRQADARVTEVFADPARHIDAFESQVHDLLGRIRKA